jgi:hypothetical protein
LLHGVQLWVALPDSDRDIAPAWEHHAGLPTWTDSGVSATVIMGSLAGAASPGRAFTPLVGVDLSLAEEADAWLPLEPEFEHAALVMSGGANVDGVDLAVGSMLYLGTGRRDLRLRGDEASRVLLLGGVPFEEEIVMWWNFVARTDTEIRAAREQWERGERFGEVAGVDAARLGAPTVPAGRLKPGGRER